LLQSPPNSAPDSRRIVATLSTPEGNLAHFKETTMNSFYYGAGH
jgi:hypothetical protein